MSRAARTNAWQRVLEQTAKPSKQAGFCAAPQTPRLSASRTASHQLHSCLFYSEAFHALRPSLTKQKPHQKALQTSSSLKPPAINRLLIGDCNRIQFISESDGLTFIITRGSACRELWAIHSLVEINSFTALGIVSSRRAHGRAAAPRRRCCDTAMLGESSTERAKTGPLWHVGERWSRGAAASTAPGAAATEPDRTSLQSEMQPQQAV